MSDSQHSVTVGVSVHDSFLTPDPKDRRAILDAVRGAGLRQVTLGDHISFHGGIGFDGLISATSVLSSDDEVRVLIGVYLLGLRHPLAVARQLATLSQVAPGRLTLGVGVGGEDRSEISNAGVDPATRGRRLDEALSVLRLLSTGEPLDHEGEFYRLTQASILPAPVPSVPIVIGGSGDVAVRRTARFGDGWLGIFCTARRFGDTVEQIRAETSGRPTPEWFGVSTWAGFGNVASSARARLDRRLEELYKLPGERFHHLTPAGTPEAVAEGLAAYVEAGARNITIVPVAEDLMTGIESAGEVQRLLNEHLDSGN